MKKELFEKIVGHNFVKTNYKVNSIEDLTEIFQCHYEDLNSRLPIDIDFTQDEMTAENYGLYYLISEMCFEYYLELQDDTSAKEYYHDVCQRLKFCLSHEDKKSVIASEFRELENKYLGNPYHYLLTTDDYYNEVKTKEFFEGYWQIFKEKYSSPVFKWKTKFSDLTYKYKIIRDIVDKDYESEDSFISLIYNLQKYTVLDFINSNLSSSSSATAAAEKPRLVLSQYNPYPSVFKNSYSYHLFNFLISLEPLRKKKTSFISKYFYLFRKKELIEENALWSEFFRYLDEEHNIIDIKRIDERARPDDDEFDYFEKIKKNFSLKYNLID